MDGRDMHYSILIQWSPEDEAYIASVPEMGNARTHGATYEEALAQAQDMLDGMVDVMQQQGKNLPEPHLLDLSK